MREHLAFACEGEQLIATLDRAGGATGLLIVSGGNEVRAGAFNGQAKLAAQVAAAGFPVFRFDRRGIGDSTGQNQGFTDSSSDIATALTCFRTACPAMRRVGAFGNCDAAAALMLQGGAGVDALVLANPWTIEQIDSAPPPEAIRARYADKLKNPREVLRLLSGKVSLGKLARGIGHALRPAPPPTSLAQDIATGLSRFTGPVRILLAENDRTAQAFLSGWDRSDPRLRHCTGAGHAFAEAEARPWLLAQVLDIMRENFS
jgi:exosortase A-associated hydrolase 1